MAGGKRARETTGGALKLHDETPERMVKDLDVTSPQCIKGETEQRNVSCQVDETGSS